MNSIVNSNGIRRMTGFGSAPIKMEGGIADPDEFTFACVCQKCQEKYDKWKAAYEAQQKQLKEKIYE